MTGIVKSRSWANRAGSGPKRNRLGYDASGRIDNKTEFVWSRSGISTSIDSTRWQYGYTNGRLTTVLKNGVTEATYAWDSNGNRLHATVDAQDRLVTQDDAHWEYDAIGHLKRRTDNRGVWDFHYDALWNLLSASKGTQTIDYVVDARGRRVGRKVNGALVQGFLYGDQLEPVAELDGSNKVVSRFVYGSRPHVPDYMIKSGVKYRLVTDHLGSVRLVVNATTGETVSRIDYDVWGQVTAATNLSFQPFGFAGGLRDDATGLVRFGARDYDPHVGRWTGKDPWGFDGNQTNLEQYSNGDPVNFVDVTGKAPYLVNRMLGGGPVLPAGLILTHTFVYTTNANGSVKHTYSWGNTANLNGWNLDQPEDMRAANSAQSHWWGSIKMGDDEMDGYVDKAFHLLINPAFNHANGLIAKNCKSEAWNLLSTAEFLSESGF